MSVSKNQAIEAEDFVKLNFPNSPALSPDGEFLIFSIRSIDEKKNTYKGALYRTNNTSDRYEQFTSGTHFDTAPQFSPSGNLLAFLSSRSEKGMQLYVMPVDGGEAIQITKFPKGVQGYAWSPTNDKIHVIARVNKEELDTIKKPDENVPPSFILDPEEFSAFEARRKQKEEMNVDPRVIKHAYNRELTFYLDNRFSQPFIVNLGKFLQGTKPEIIHVGEFGYHYSLGTFDKLGALLYLFRFKSDPSISLTQELFQINVKDPEEKKYLLEGYGWIHDLNVSPDGAYLSFEGIREEKIVYDDTQIFLVDLKEKNKMICLTEDFPRSSLNSKWYDDETIFFLSPADGKRNIFMINIHSRKTTAVVKGNRDITSFNLSKKGKIAYVVSHITYPSDIFWCHIDGSKEERVTEVNNEFIDEHQIYKALEFSFEREGVEFQGWVLTPSNHDGVRKLPVALEIHGGPAAMWTPHEVTMWHEWNTIVSKGYAVVFCNPRGSDGYGIDFRGCVRGNWGHMPANDILQGLDTALLRYPFLDSDHLVVTGGSYGGYMTAWLVTQTNRFKAAVSQRGVYEFFAFGMTTDIAIWFELQYKGELLDRYQEIWEDQPIAHIRKVETPLLIIHSENDFRVPIATAEQLFWLGKRYGKIIELIRYPRDGHELSRSGEPRHIIDRIKRIIDWFEKYNK